MNLKLYLERKKKIVDKRLGALLPSAETFPQKIHEAMRYSLFIGGKRIRPILCLAACEAAGGSYKEALDFACGIELVHTYSLIHDDLPCMDDDDFRRGKPTSHRVFGEAAAVLAGDALLTHAFHIFASAEDVPEKIKPVLIRKMAEASGSKGLIGGQMVDLESEGKRPDAKILEYIHKHKTACLISAAVETGAMIGRADKKRLASLKKYGDLIGLTFQIADDILDIVGTKEKLGKGIGKDIAQKKLTFPAVYGIERSREILEQKTNKALASLSRFDEKAEPLREIAKFIAERDV